MSLFYNSILWSIQRDDFAKMQKFVHQQKFVSPRQSESETAGQDQLLPENIRNQSCHW